MPQSLLRTPLLIFMIGISYFSLFVTLTLAFNPPIIQESFPWRKPVIGSIFGAICALGIIAILFPNQCSATFHLTKGEKDTYSNADDLVSQGNAPTLRGHHLDCGNFSAHVIRIDDKTFCAACTGLLLGALIALAGTALYFFDDWRITQNSVLAVIIGTLGVGLGLFQFKFERVVRLLLNVSFVLGTFLVLVGIDKLIESVLVDLFLVVLTLFWLLTRILLSQWDHWKICHTCESPCEIRVSQKKEGSVSAAQPVEGANDN